MDNRDWLIKHLFVPLNNEKDTIEKIYLTTSNPYHDVLDKYIKEKNMVRTTWIDPASEQEYSYDWGFPIDAGRKVNNKLKEARDYRLNDCMTASEILDNMIEKHCKKENKKSMKKWKNPLDIKNVIFNPPATIVIWEDGTKTVVKAQNDEYFDPEKGLTMAIAKKVFGNKGNYFNQIKKWTKPYEKACEEAEAFTLNVDTNAIAQFAKDAVDKLNETFNINRGVNHEV